MEDKKIIIKTEHLTRKYAVPSGEFVALHDINLELKEGSFAILKGRSGSGKTTLMNLIGMLDDPSEGKVFIDGVSVDTMSEREKENYRRSNMGFVFQAVSLIPSLSALQNVIFSLRLAGERDSKLMEERAQECLNIVGLGKRVNHMPPEMSGGEQQRVAIARALAHRPKLILADEPTAELDSLMAAKMAQLFQEISHNEGITILMTTHDQSLMGAADEIIELDAGERING